MTYEARRYAMMLGDEVRLLRDCGDARPLVDALAYDARSPGCASRARPVPSAPDVPAFDELSAACARLAAGHAAAHGAGRAVVQHLLDVRVVRDVMES